MLFTAEEIYRALHSLPPVDQCRADSFTVALYKETGTRLPTSAAVSLPHVRKLTFEKMVRDGRVVWGLNIR
jgi:hypothetical protein